VTPSALGFVVVGGAVVVVTVVSAGIACDCWLGSSSFAPQPAVVLPSQAVSVARVVLGALLVALVMVVPTPAPVVAAPNLVVAQLAVDRTWQTPRRRLVSLD
jgi:hypothetical protein